MAEESVITEDFKKLLGIAAEPEVFEVEKGHIKRFAEAIGDPNPLWSDEAYAAKSRYGKIVAPPTFLVDAGIIKTADKLMAAECPLPSFLNGGTELEFYRPIEVGDKITTVAKVVDLQEKTGQSGKLLFIILEITYTNQRGELVTKCRETFIRR